MAFAVPSQTGGSVSPTVGRGTGLGPAGAGGWGPPCPDLGRIPPSEGYNRKVPWRGPPAVPSHP
jgi:hypothetical protein